MENLIIEESKSTPRIEFNSTGELTIQGRLITENAVMLFDPMNQWIDNISCSRVIFTIELDYMNTSASMHLFSLLRKLEDNCEIKSITVNWLYEEDDEDHLETGEMFEDKLSRISFNYREVTDSAAA